MNLSPGGFGATESPILVLYTILRTFGFQHCLKSGAAIPKRLFTACSRWLGVTTFSP
jgi:hypothetical protein